MSFVLDSPTKQGFTLIAHLSPELKLVGECLSNQLDGLKELLSQREFFIQKRVKEEHRVATEKLLRFIHTYVGGTLMELLKAIRDLSNLMEIYDRQLHVFIRRAPSTLKAIDLFIEKMQDQAERHSTAYKEVVALSEEMKDLIQKYLASSDTHNEMSSIARIASISLIVAGTFTAGISFTPVAIGVMGHRVMTGVAALAVGGGGIGEVIARHDQNKADLCAEAVDRLVTVQDYIRPFESPMFEILKKLRISKEHLQKLKIETLEATASNCPSGTTPDDIEEIFRVEAYRFAKKEAHEIKELCAAIGMHAETIERLQAQVEARCKQLTPSVDETKVICSEKDVKCQQLIEA